MCSSAVCCTCTYLGVHSVQHSVYSKVIMDSDDLSM